MKRSFSRKNLWERAPRLVRQTIGRGLGLIPPAYLLGSRFREWLRFAEQAQWWDAERIRAYQLERLRHICALAYQRTRYYRQAWDSVGFRPGDLKSLDDIAGLPKIDKETVRDHLEEMMAVAPESPDIDYVSTGGSSGVTLRFYIGRQRSAIEYAHLVSGWQRIGYRLGMPMAAIRGRVIAGGRRYEYDPLLRHHNFSNFDMTDENMRWYLRRISRLGPCVLHVYPSSIATLAAFCARAGIRMPPNIVGILAESEMVYPQQREMVANFCGARFFSSYGHSEKLVAAAECEHTRLYHVWPTYGYFELLDETGRAVNTVGQTGEIVGTGFINEVMPFVRYRTGDFATYAGEGCQECGRQQVLLGEIVGRSPRHVLVASDGALISMTALNLHDDTFEKVRQYQFYQEKPGRAVLRVVPHQPLSAADLERIRKGLAPKLAGRISLRVEVVSRVQLTESGKFNLVDQRISDIDHHCPAIPSAHMSPAVGGA